jgi:dCMP deaminase
MEAFVECDLLRNAYRIADIYSDDPHTKNGAVLVNRHGEVIGSGANSLPIGVETRDRLARPKKYSFIEHAERNAIFAACRQGECTAGGTLYCPWFACADCARAIIQAGIRLVIGHKQMFDRADGRWCESIAYGNEMLREAAVETRLYDGKIGGVTNLFNGERWEP